MIYSLLLTAVWAFLGGYLAKKKGLNVKIWAVIAGALWSMGLLLCLAYSFYDTYKKKKLATQK